MTLTQLYSNLDQRIPSSLSCPWDNDGIMCADSCGTDVKKVLISLDVTDEVIEKAVSEGYDLILSHHPLIFKGLTSITDQNTVSARVLKLIKNSIAVFSFHTRLDALTGGVNDTLSQLIGLRDTTAFGNNGEEIGRIGYLEAPISAEELAKKVKDVLNVPSVSLSDASRPAHRVAVLGGSGSDDVSAAIAAGADTYISGEISYHHMVDAPENRINLITAGHFYTEFPICQVLANMIGEIDSTIICEVFNSNKIKMI